MTAADGFLVVDKPAGVSSAWVVGKVKYRLKPCFGKAFKVGHGGTLDPFATGVLPLGLGRGTKRLQALLEGDKTYEFTLKFGTKTSTGDPEGEVVKTGGLKRFKEVEERFKGGLEEVLDRFTGDILQVPPAFSALKVDGQRAYALARRGEAVALAPRTVKIESLRLLEPLEDGVVLEARVGKGTYIRTLGEDIAAALGTIGHVAALRRTGHGPFTAANAVDWETLDKALEMGDWERYLLSLDACLGEADTPQA